jgi:hypothetical protein
VVLRQIVFGVEIYILTITLIINWNKRLKYVTVLSRVSLLTSSQGSGMANADAGLPEFDVDWCQPWPVSFERKREKRQAPIQPSVGLKFGSNSILVCHLDYNRPSASNSPLAVHPPTIYSDGWIGAWRNVGLQYSRKVKQNLPNLNWRSKPVTAMAGPRQAITNTLQSTNLKFHWVLSIRLDGHGVFRLSIYERRLESVILPRSNVWKRRTLW